MNIVGEFYSKDLKAIIAKNDWEGLKAATAEPPKRTKADKAKPDGGIAERAAKAGGFSDARVLTACDLFAAGFSDNSISAKTKAMKAEVDVMRNVVEEMNLSARIALGETKPEGGLFGMGGKKPSVQELAQNVRKLYIDGGNGKSTCILFLYIYDLGSIANISMLCKPTTNTFMKRMRLFLSRSIVCHICNENSYNIIVFDQF